MFTDRQEISTLIGGHKSEVIGFKIPELLDENVTDDFYGELLLYIKSEDLFTACTVNVSRLYNNQKI